MSSTGGDRKKLIIDCDAGIDDAQAIFLALSENDVDVLAITCVSGNVHVDQVCVNVLKILEVCGRTDIPIYKGADRGLLGKMLSHPATDFVQALDRILLHFVDLKFNSSA